VRHLLLAALAVTFVSATLVAPAEAKSRSTCTKQVKAKEQYLTPGGRCGGDCQAAISACMKGKKV
jgi:hypothetical protein